MKVGDNVPKEIRETIRKMTYHSNEQIKAQTMVESWLVEVFGLDDVDDLNDSGITDQIIDANMYSHNHKKLIEFISDKLREVSASQ